MRSVLAGSDPGDAEVLVVDNASSDESPAIAERLADEHEQVRLLRSPTNRGYAGAVNFALPEARGEQIAVLNMDVVVSPGWLDPLVGLLDSKPEAGVACPLIMLESDPDLINAAGQTLNISGLGFNRWLGKAREIAGSEPFRVDGLHGAAFLIRKSLLEELGGWDETGFLYFEDVELSWLLRIAAAEIWCVPSSTVVHDYHLTMFPHKLFLLERNRRKMLLADLGPGTRIALAPLLGLTGLMMWGYCLLRGRRFLRAKWDTYRWTRAHRQQIRSRRAQIESVRRRTDREVLRGLTWRYPLDQFLTLGRERGESERDRLSQAA